jgi:hypothetical protein
VLAAVLAGLLWAVGNLYLSEGRIGSARWSSGDVLTTDVSNGLYETRAGRSVLFVRGQVENRTKAPAKVRVHAEIWDGAQLVKTVEGLAGATAAPEELYLLSSPQEVQALNAKLKAEAKAVGPQGRAPFLLAFDSYPPEPAGLKLRVTASVAGP